MMQRAYKTVLRAGEDEHTEKKSRFIGSASPCKTEEEALMFLNGIRNTYKDARHHCYAYIIGENKGIMRYSDDGEPQGTAGLPIIETMKSMDVTDCCVVVTRYFGGVLLGTGGLTRAYRKGCQIALEAAGIITVLPGTVLVYRFTYPVWEKVRNELKNAPVAVGTPDYGAYVTVSLSVRADDEASVSKTVTSVCNGSETLLSREEKPLFWPEPSR